MKKQVLICLLLLFAITANAQKAVLFRIKYLPTHSYRSTTTWKIITPASSKEDFISIISLAEIKTRALNKDKTIPYIISYNTKEMKLVGQDFDSETPDYTEKPIYGHFDLDGKQYIDSLSTKKNAETVKAELAKSLTEGEGNIKFPEKPLRVGESFSRESEFNAAILPTRNKLILTTEYKLVSIENNIAVFETSSATRFNFGSRDGNSVAGTGKGTGRIIFNVDKNYPLSISSELILDYSGSSTSIDSGPSQIAPATARFITTVVTEVSADK